MSQGENYDRHKMALLIRGSLWKQGKTQTGLAKKLNLNRQFINLFLNRRIDLLTTDIEAILDELGIRKQAEKMCGLKNG